MGAGDIDPEVITGPDLFGNDRVLPMSHAHDEREELFRYFKQKTNRPIRFLKDRLRRLDMAELYRIKDQCDFHESAGEGTWADAFRDETKRRASATR